MTLSPDVAAVLGAAFRVFVTWQVVWGLAAFVAVWQDKLRATGGRRRVPERTLHRAEAWGGWAGSLLAQQVFRHKTRKATYRRVVWRITAGWVLTWVAVVTVWVVVRS